MGTSVRSTDRDDDRDDISDKLRRARPEHLRPRETETERILNDEDLMDSIRRGREQRRRGEAGTSLENARREILGEDG